MGKKRKKKGKGKKDKKGKKKKNEKKDKTKKDQVGLAKDRGCTDILCLLIFILFLVGWVGVGFFAYTHGDPRKLYYPTNSSGFICGQDENAGREYSLYFNILKCLSLSAPIGGCPTVQACVEECPTFIKYAYSAGVGNVIPGTIINDEETKHDMSPFCQYNVQKVPESYDALVEAQICPPYVVPSKPIMGRCLPDVDKLTGGALPTPGGMSFDEAVNRGEMRVQGGPRGISPPTTPQNLDGQQSTPSVSSTTSSNTTEATVDGSSDSYNASSTTASPSVADDSNFIAKIRNATETALDILGARDFFFKALADIKLTWYLILACLGMSLVLALLWIWTLRYTTRFLVWGTILIFVALLALLTLFSFWRRKELAESGAGLDFSLSLLFGSPFSSWVRIIRQICFICYMPSFSFSLAYSTTST